MKQKIALLILGLLFFITRFYNLNNAPVWEDNFSWLYRINYYPWVLENNFKGHPEPGKDLKYTGTVSYHPGVTLMTLSGISTRIGKKVLRSIDRNYKDCGFYDTKCPYLYTELFISKLPLILLTGSLFIICLFLITRIFNFGTALVFGIFILSEPIFYQTSRDLHLDFLQAIFILTSLLVLLADSKNEKKIIISGILFGLTILTRFVSLFFLPSIIYIISKTASKRFVSVWLFSISFLVVFIILYPPMWFHPVNTIKYIIQGSLDSTNVGTQTLSPPISYFRGIWDYTSQSLNKENGVSFSWIAALISSVFYSIYNFKKIKTNKPFWHIVLVFLVYFIFINFSNKRYFRYITPPLIGLTLNISFILNEIFFELKRKFRPRT